MNKIFKIFKFHFEKRQTMYKIGDRVYLKKSSKYPGLQYREATIKKVIKRKDILYKVILDLYPSVYQLIPIPEYFKGSEIEFIDKKSARANIINNILDSDNELSDAL